VSWWLEELGFDLAGRKEAWDGRQRLLLEWWLSWRWLGWVARSWITRLLWETIGLGFDTNLMRDKILRKPNSKIGQKN
jgi:hypothetical protein